MFIGKCILAAVLVVCLCDCSGKTDDKKHQDDSKVATPPIVALCLSIDYSDTAFLHSDKAMADYVKDIVRLMARSDSTDTAKALDIFFGGLGGDSESLRRASRFAHLYLGNPNSPVKNETLYLRFLASMLSRSDLPEDVAAHAEDRRHRALLNRPGTRANDFRFIDRDGHEGSLHSVKAPQTMLIFYDPECPHCPEILERIANDSKVNAAIEAASLKVLAVYTEGKRDMWEKRKGELPVHWTAAYDLSGIVDGEIYDIPAMPTVYLLDTDKCVLVKDMPW